jgi:hypothetical protein
LGCYGYQEVLWQATKEKLLLILFTENELGSIIDFPKDSVVSCGIVGWDPL